MVEMSSEYKYILIDQPMPFVQRITLNRPEKRNAMSNDLRIELFKALEVADVDDKVRVIILRGAGKCFSSGYDLSFKRDNWPYHTSRGIGLWSRHVVEGCFRIWDLAKPVIAQVHGYCLAGGTELASSCDLVYVAEDAQIGYPPVRMMSPPDNQIFPWLMGMRRAMEMMLTGDYLTGLEAVEAGFANRAFALDSLEAGVLTMAERLTKVPPALQQMNKRAVHRQMEIMGIRAGVRAGAEIQAQAIFIPEVKEYYDSLRKNITEALDARDGKYGDYRTTNKSE
ncbi:enoyl-CoA hydratase-related protein [Sphingosinicella xenopeptidilytica]|uniref:Enoyl-CoA hydratase-related protein n=1 Tax=Sphingosinicella xenopeptidilytica TaxID=364098 RepID=A0ABW3C4W7_SPHXN